MSHETKIRDNSYNNIDGVNYFDASFRDHDGSIQHRRFAKYDNKFGVVPTILQTLISERNAIKKQMKKVSDPFKLKILDTLSSIKIKAIITEYNNKSKFKK